MSKISYSGRRFPPEIIQHAVWLYFRFPLSFRAAERWRTVKITDFERRQMRAFRAELDREYEAQTGLDKPTSKANPQTQLSSKSRT